MRIIILADSLGRPRPDLAPEERTEYEDTYPYLLRRHFPSYEVEICYVESLDSDDAIFWNERMVAFRRPNIVLYHFGINDCAPRVFRKGSRSILLASWFRRLTRDYFLRGIHRMRRYLIRSIFRNKVYVPLKRFKENFLKMRQDVLNYAPHCRFWVLGISAKPDWLEQRSPGYNANISVYNAALREIFADHFLDVQGMVGETPENQLISDGVHFTKETHRKLYEHLSQTLEKNGVSL